jgi:hypothetical protein
VAAARAVAEHVSAEQARQAAAVQQVWQGAEAAAAAAAPPTAASASPTGPATRPLVFAFCMFVRADVISADMCLTRAAADMDVDDFFSGAGEGADSAEPLTGAPRRTPTPTDGSADGFFAIDPSD